MNRIYYLNVLRLLATLSVVFLHASAGIYDNMVSDHSNFEIALSIDKSILGWGVPVFVLISGALFLRTDKEITYPILIEKYVRRIALALFVFGFPMCLMETIFSHTGGGNSRFRKLDYRTLLGAYVVPVYAVRAIYDNSYRQAIC